MEQALERFLKVAEDGGKFMNDLDKMFQDMGIKPSNRYSSSSDGTPPITGRQCQRKIHSQFFYTKPGA